MITNTDLEAAIAECQGTRNPTSSTCIKLAAYYTIMDHMKNKEEKTELYSYSSTAPGRIDYGGNSEFASAIYGKEPNEVLAIVDELMDTLSVINPKLYNSVMRQL